MSRWQAVVFDLDDTLYPERDFVLSGFRAVAQWAETHLGIGAEHGYRQLCSLYTAGIRGDTFNRWLHAQGMSAPNLPQQLVKVYREHTPSLTPFRGVLDVLSRLRSGHRLGLVSDGYIDVQRRKLAALGLETQFDAVVFSDYWGREAWKPSTRPFEEVLRRLGVAACFAVYVADNPIKDFVGARGAGMSSVWTRHPDGEYAQLVPPTPQHAPDYTIGSFAEFENLLG